MKEKNKNKDTKAQKRLKQYNEIQALIRKPKYLQDYKDYEEGKTTALLISRKWGIPNPISPAFKKYSREILKDIEFLQPVMVIPHEEIPDEKTNFEKGRKTIIKIPNKLYKHHFEDGRYLHLKIDLMAEGKIVNGVKDKIKFYSQFIKKDKTSRGQDCSYDKWQIYNFYHDDNLTFSQIARKLNPNITKSSVTDSEYKKTYEAVKRAYNAAKKMINEFKPVKK